MLIFINQTGDGWQVLAVHHNGNRINQIFSTETDADQFAESLHWDFAIQRAMTGDSVH